VFGVATEAALRAFQQSRGLRETGVCDDTTWSALVEASWKLGDRHLYLRRPPLRGDDVADLQARLGRLGFDCGWVDGIFGPSTSTAVGEFQRNVGLSPDGVVGHETFRALQRLAMRSQSGQLVNAVRQALRFDHAMPNPRLVVGHEGNLAALVRSLARTLRARGARVVTTDDGSSRVNASVANRFDAELYVGLASESDEPWVGFYESHGFASPGGRRLAETLVRALSPEITASTRGMRLPILRETQMPAVIIELGRAGRLADRHPDVTSRIADGIVEWCRAPGAEPSS
jgi:N-acetylmuramoyl-L-alanine amidase